ncbi:hypothetical protein BGX30_008902, partial [Mortierella sp. GBA39]
MLGTTSQTPVPRLVELVSTKIHRERAFAIVANLANHSRHLHNVIASDYKMVLDSAKHFLEYYAMSQLRIEAAESYGLRHTIVDPTRSEQEHFVESQ